MSVLSDLQHQLRLRKRNRERKRRLKQGHKAQREARGVRKLRHRIELLLSPRTLFDAVTVGNIPSDAKAVAGYVNGRYKTWPDILRLFPKAKRVSIAISADADADVLDIETGDATNDQAAAWFRRKKSNRGFYTSASNADALVATLKAAGIQRAEYVLWTAHYDGKHICGPHTCGEVRSTEADGTQFTTHEETLDESVLKPSFWERG